MKGKWSILLLCAVWMIWSFTACGTEAADTENTSITEDTDSAEISEETVQDKTDQENNSTDSGTPSRIQADLSNAVSVSMSDSSMEINGTGADVSDHTVIITDGGTYLLSGSLSDGRIVVDAAGETVILVLNGVQISCSYSSPIYIYKAETAIIQVQDGTENVLTDGSNYIYEDIWSSSTDGEPDACLYSKSDLILQGSGSLTVNANFNNGITSKDNLGIFDLILQVQAADHGINGKDSCRIDSSYITVVCSGDALRSTNDSDETLGWITVSESTLNLTAGEDGIQAETDIEFTDTVCTITSGGGSSVTPTDAVSAKGIKAGSLITLSSGTFELDCSDDAVHSDGDMVITGGSFILSTQDDGFHADNDMSISGGNISILTCYEGLESSTMSISGGTFSITASDDCINVAGGQDSSGFGGFGGGNMFTGISSAYSLEITGGYLVLTAGGDGLDSNGSITMSGGTVLVASTGTDDGAVDYETDFTLSGGTLLAVNSSSMWITTPTDSRQNTISITFDSTLSAGSLAAVETETETFVFQLPIDTINILFSSPELLSGDSCTIYTGGVYTGALTDWIGNGGDYSGGVTLTEFTLTDSVTSYGTARGSARTGMGGMTNGRGGDRPG